ncbi:Sfl1p SKDI_15G2870 [Saccharomyces kudriavzevii IFO 1802]|uniref:SFL1-like protein n=2 Tax=Saccharomyces kudriavzevii (strain ATCC MYA-4449 / AS 2.2408 / CBS 8840 / NBRC 1802 / NCYC 2889) TaxID=226230 RepID=J6EFG2_SACK1|nr:uncharacterized protein SKDI_15G2870 [Saccharomyces kudriavzevii IFO 1802]EJT42282.1 SFL1-like protein [Saccharomyces kudriavzevii IFO 1802]CAI4051660.1 hypothetical protein SKDI_15G2870 [Saccharomyces kudriavzevii IFO 1802]
MSEEETVPAPAAAGANPGVEGGDASEDVKKHGSKMLVGPRPPQNAIFIHKLYQILEDDSLHDLIWWSSSGLSFMIKPVERFSKALATYFKHTNITSFVRQLNIYGFHKVSHDHNSNEINSGDDANTNDVNSTNDDGGGSKNSSGEENNGATVQEKEKEKSNPTKIWEFKHSSGIFKKGDIEGLKHIKRRASSRNNSSINSRKNSSNQNYDADSGVRARPSSIQDPTATSNGFCNYVPQISGANNPIPECFNNSHVPYENATHGPMEFNNPETQEQARPSSFQDETLTHLKEINVDMIKIIESMQHFISLQHNFCSKSFTFKNVSKKKSENIMKDHQKQLKTFENDMLTFKQHVMSRAHRTMDSLHAATATATAPALASSSACAPKSQYDMMVPPGNQYVPQKSSSSTNIPSRFNTSSVPPSQFFVQYQPQPQLQPQQHMAYSKQPAHMPNFINQPIPIQQLPPQYADTFNTPQMMHNPFASKNGHKPGNTKRTNSVLMDPLTPATSVGIQGTLNYPIMNINPTVRDYNKSVPQNMAPSPIYPINEPTTRMYSQPKMRSLGSTSSLPNDRRNSPLKLTPRSSLNEDSLYSKPKNSLKSSISGTSLSSSFTLVSNNPAPIRYSQQGLLRSLNKAANCPPDSVIPLDSTVLTGPTPKNMDNLPAISSNLINSPMNVEHGTSLSHPEPTPGIELPQPSLPTTNATKKIDETDNTKRSGSGVYSLLNQEESRSSNADPRAKEETAPPSKKVRM